MCKRCICVYTYKSMCIETAQNGQSDQVPQSCQVEMIKGMKMAFWPHRRLCHLRSLSTPNPLATSCRSYTIFAKHLPDLTAFRTRQWQWMKPLRMNTKRRPSGAQHVCLIRLIPCLDSTLQPYFIQFSFFYLILHY